MMAQQCREFLPKLAVMATEEAANALRDQISDLPIRVSCGEAGLIEAASIEEAECVITAVVGMVGLKPTLAAIRAGKRIGLANKETLVCAGELVMAEAERYGVEIIPVDSEHSAIYQCLMGVKDSREIKRLILTCSGGPFFGMERGALRHVTKADALKHPNWKMGAKITIDCATLMNKGLEVIEAMRLYRMDVDQVDVVIHRQSIVHSMVELVDGAVMAQLGAPDMRLPIQLALTYPERTVCPVDALDLCKCGALTFCEPDMESFPCLALARRCAKMGGTACAVMNGANEEAVALFLDDKIGFYDIYDLVARAVEEVPNVIEPTLEDILQADRLARESVRKNAV
jgi:1-deoxy-D-xylulose-5-phosphate reductoisomerase